MYNKILDYCLQTMMSNGADLAQAEVIVSEKHELNTETNEIKLFRTTENVNVLLTYIKDSKKGSLKINKYDEKSITQAVRTIQNLAAASPADEAYDIAPNAVGSFEIGVTTPDLDEVYESLNTFNKEVQVNYPKVLGDAILSYDYQKRFLANSNGLNLEEVKGHYSFDMMFSAKENDKLTSFNYTSASTDELKTKLMDLGLLGDLLAQSEKELDAKSLSQKFVGDVIITPHCMNDMIGIFSGISVSDGVMIQGTSIFKDKKDKRVASPMLNWHSSPRSLSAGYAVTTDGIEAKDMTVIENGVLKSFILSQYAGKKTGLGHSGNTGNAHVIDPGDKSFKELIKAVEKGILLCRFSGGMPGPDGNFSGVAKNSFYIENGEIMFPISETMISGNLFDMFKDIKGISKEQVDFGMSKMPYIHTINANISSK